MTSLRFIVVLFEAQLLTGAAPVVHVHVDDGTYSVEGAFESAASPTVAWKVLSDYDHIGQFVSSIRRSAVVSRVDGGVLVDQEATGTILLFSHRVDVRLEIHEDQGRSIAFRDVLKSDFTAYEGRWTIAPTARGARIVYTLTARPRTRLPGFIGTGAFTRNVSGLLAEVRAEMERRAAHSAH